MNALALSLVQMPADDARLAAIHRIRADCAADLEARFGPGHWALATLLSRVQEEAAAKSVYAVALDRTVVATLSLTRTAPRFFNLQQFQHPAAPAAYLSSLAVAPDYQRLGIGTWCMREADRVAIAWECHALRFDAYDSPAGAAAFYERNGYQRRARLSFNKVPLLLFEKVFEVAS